MSKEPKIFETIEAAKIALISALIVALIGVITAGINAYGNYLSNRAQIELPILATQTAEARLTSVAPSQTPTAILTSTITPTITSSLLSASPALEISLIPTNTNQPIPLPTPDVHLGIESGCIDERFWTAYDGTDIKTNGNGCLQLSDWGFFAQEKVLYFLPPRSYDSQTHSIYTTLSGNVDITFNFQVDRIQTGTRQANIRMGIVSSNNGEGKFLTYHYLPEYPDNLYPKLWQDGHYGDPFLISLKKGNAQKVTISVQNNFLTITLDGQTVVNKLVLRFDNRLFWIDYFLPPSSELSAYISEFSIVGR